MLVLENPAQVQPVSHQRQRRGKGDALHIIAQEVGPHRLVIRVDPRIVQPSVELAAAVGQGGVHGGVDLRGKAGGNNLAERLRRAVQRDGIAPHVPRIVADRPGYLQRHPAEQPQSSRCPHHQIFPRQRASRIGLRRNRGGVVLGLQEHQIQRGGIRSVADPSGKSRPLIGGGLRLRQRGIGVLLHSPFQPPPHKRQPEIAGRQLHPSAQNLVSGQCVRGERQIAIAQMGGNPLVAGAYAELVKRLAEAAVLIAVGKREGERKIVQIDVDRTRQDIGERIAPTRDAVHAVKKPARRHRSGNGHRLFPADTLKVLPPQIGSAPEQAQNGDKNQGKKSVPVH